jgi:hypothetical protein
VSCATSINGGWYVWTIDTGLEEARSVRSTRVFGFIGESRGEDVTCGGTEEDWLSWCRAGALTGEELEVGERGGTPKADMNESTAALTQGGQ